jgi:hypothetical protein
VESAEWGFAGNPGAPGFAIYDFRFMIGGDRLTGRRGLDKVAGEMEQAGRNQAETVCVFHFIQYASPPEAGKRRIKLYNHCWAGNMLQ